MPEGRYISWTTYGFGESATIGFTAKPTPSLDEHEFGAFLQDVEDMRKDFARTLSRTEE